MDLSPELIAQLQDLINQGVLNQTGRSPIRERQLKDLRLVPTATDPRPLFLPSAEAPRDAKPYVYTKWPSLRWHKDTGQEITVKDAKAAAELGPEWTETPAHMKAADPMADMTDALAALSEKERAAILKNQKDLRMERLQSQLAQLSEMDLDAVLQSARDRAKPEHEMKSA